MEFTDVAQVADAARNFEILRDRDDYDRPERSDKRHKSGDQHQSSNQQNSHRGHDQRNDRHGSDRQGGSGNYRNNNSNNHSRDNNRNSGAGRDHRNRGQQSHRATNSGNSIDVTSLFAICLKIHVSRSIIESGSQQNKAPSEGYTYPVCTTCGRRHPGECRRAAGTCFKCGQAGHLQRDCKKNTGASSSGYADKKPDASGRVFALTQDQAANTTGTITGALFIFGRAVIVLFDTGATHSVLSTKFASCFTMTPVPLDHVLCISTPMKDSARITHVYRDLPLQFNDKIRSVNALLLDMCEFDIILGMDWLSAHHATIDCHSRRVIFGNIHTPEFIYHGSLPGKSMKIISALEARTLLSHGCEGFLANIHDTTSDVSSIHDQPIVSEFQDVFPEELPGIPPIRDVEFNIELIPGADQYPPSSLSHAPDSKELKDSVARVVAERGFIRPSVSVHGGAPGAKHSSKKDLRSGLPSVTSEIAGYSRLLFRTRYGHYEFLVMPFGLTNAPCISYDEKTICQVFSANFELSRVALSGSHSFHQNGLPWIRTKVYCRRFVDGFFTIGLKLGLSSCKGDVVSVLKDYDTNIHSSGKQMWCYALRQPKDDGENLGNHSEFRPSRPSFMLIVMAFYGRALICQQVKIEHQRASGLLQPLEIPVWKWDEISMDFVTGLPRTQRKHDAIWVVVDRLTKTAHFLPIRKDFSISRLAEMFQQEIVRSYSVLTSQQSYPIEIHFHVRVSERFTERLGTKAQFSTAFIQRQTDSQNGNAVLPILLGSSFLDERVLEGPEMIEVTNEKVAVAREKLKEAQTRQKSYADKHRRLLEFQPGEHVFLKVSPTRGVRRFGIKGKLSPRFIGPFEILERVGEVSYRLALPPQLSHVHNVFHVSLLRGYKYHHLHVVSYPFGQIREDYRTRKPYLC
ncbi:putative reverse transcriptase domain-containing protein [Tanacetum coccineum]